MSRKRRLRSPHLDPAAEFDENLFPPDDRLPNPEEVALQYDSGTLRRKALQTLALNFREVRILRGVEGIPDGEIADIIAPARLSATAALQNLPMDVAVVIDATDTYRAWNGNVLSGPNVAPLRGLRPDGRSGPQPGIIRGDRRS